MELRKPVVQTFTTGIYVNVAGKLQRLQCVVRIDRFSRVITSCRVTPDSKKTKVVTETTSHG